MKFLLLCFIFALQTNEKKQKCNFNMLQYYGLEGVENPVDYDAIKSNLNYDFCPET